MPSSSAAMELKVLINILTQGQALPQLLNQTKQLSQALAQLQAQANAAGAAAAGTVPGGATAQAAQAAAAGMTNAGNAAAGASPNLLTFAAAAGKVTAALKFMAGGFLAYQSVRFVKDIADTAARTQVLGTVLHVVAMNAGITSEEIDKVSRGVQRLGITAQSARQSLTQFIQAGLNIKFAEPLARAAQDLAVVSGTDSSQTYERLIRNVQQLDTLGLRWMGIIVSRTEADAKFKAQNKEITGELSNRQHQEALLIEVIEKARSLEGAYAASMGDVGKQLTSLTRYFQDLKTAIGDQLLPAYSAMVLEFSNFLAKAQVTARVMAGQKEGANAVGKSFGDLAHVLNEIASFFVDHIAAVWFVIKAYAAWRIALGIYKLLADGSALLVKFTEYALKSALAIQAATGATSGWAMALAGLRLVSIIGLITALAFSIEQVAIAIGKYYSARARGQSTMDFLTTKDERNLVRQLLGWDPESQAISKALKLQASQVQEIANAEVKLKTALDRETATQRDFVEKKREDADQDIIDAAEIANKIAKSEREAAEKALDDAMEALKKRDPVMYAREKARADNNKEAQRLIDHGKEMQQAAEEAFGGKIVFDDLDAIPAAFQKAIGHLDAFIRDFDEITKKPKEATGRLKDAVAGLGELPASAARIQEALRLAVPTVTNNEALERFLKRIPDVISRLKQAGASAKELGDVNRFVALARRGAAEGERQTFAPLVADRKEAVKLQADAVTAGQQRLLNVTQRNAELEEIRLRTQLDRNLITIKDYYDARVDLVRTTSDAEAEVQGSKTLALRAALEQSKKDGETENQQNAIRAQIAESVEASRAIYAKKEQQTAALRAEEGDKLYQGDKQTIALAKELAAQYGAYAEKVKNLNYQIDQEIEKNQQLEGADRAAANRNAELKRTQGLYELLQEARTQEFQDAEKTRELQRSALDLEQQRLSAAKSAISAREGRGEITEQEAMRLRNAVTYQSMREEGLRLNSLQLSQLATEAFWKQKLIDLEKNLQDLLEAGTITEATAQQKRLEMQQQQAAALQQAASQVEGAKAAYQDLGQSIESNSQRLREAITSNLSDALTEMTVNFRKAGDIWKRTADSIAREIVGTFAKMLVQKAVQKFLMLFATGGGKGVGLGDFGVGGGGGVLAAEGGMVSGPGTGTSDSIPAMVSAGEHIMPASKAAKWMPLLEGIRLGKLSPAFALGGVVALQSIAPSSLIPRRYANGGVVISDGGAASVTPGAGGPSHMVVSLHPDAMNMTLREWLEHEVVRQQGRR